MTYALIVLNLFTLSVNQYLVVKFLKETVQPGLGHLHGAGLVGYVAHLDQDHHQLQETKGVSETC